MLVVLLSVPFSLVNIVQRRGIFYYSCTKFHGQGSLYLNILSVFRCCPSSHKRGVHMISGLPSHTGSPRNCNNRHKSRQSLVAATILFTLSWVQVWQISSDHADVGDISDWQRNCDLQLLPRTAILMILRTLAKAWLSVYNHSEEKDMVKYALEAYIWRFQGISVRLNFQKHSWCSMYFCLFVDVSFMSIIYYCF